MSLLYFLTTTAYMTGDQSKIELSLNSGAGQSVSFSSWGSHSIPKHQLPCETVKSVSATLQITNYRQGTSGHVVQTVAVIPALAQNPTYKWGLSAWEGADQGGLLPLLIQSSTLGARTQRTY